jgi:chromosome segregation ATPase
VYFVEVERLNTQLDELNSALDHLEEENEKIQARLLQLLESSRQLRIDNQAERLAALP